MERLLTLQQVAVYLNVSARTVRRLVARRSVPYHRFGRVVRFKEQDITRWIEARKEG